MQLRRPSRDQTRLQSGISAKSGLFLVFSFQAFNLLHGETHAEGKRYATVGDTNIPFLSMRRWVSFSLLHVGKANEATSRRAVKASPGRQRARKSETPVNTGNESYFLW